MLQQISDPLAIFGVRLTPRYCFYVLRVHQHLLKLPLQHRPYRPPIDACSFHRHVGDPVLLQPIPQRQQFARERSENSHLLLLVAIRLAHTHPSGHGLLGNVQSRATPIHNLHASASWATAGGSLLVRESPSRAHCRGSGDNSLCLQASRSDSFAGLSAPLNRTTFVRKWSIPTLRPLASIFILRCDRNGRARLLS